MPILVRIPAGKDGAEAGKDVWWCTERLCIGCGEPHVVHDRWQRKGKSVHGNTDAEDGERQHPDVNGLRVSESTRKQGGISAHLESGSSIFPAELII